MNFKKGDHVTVATAKLMKESLRTELTGAVGTVSGEPDPVDKKLPVMFDAIGLRHIDPAALEPRKRRMKVSIVADTPAEMSLGLVGFLQQRLLEERESKTRARTQRDRLIIEGRENLLREILGVLRDAEIAPSSDPHPPVS